jgi:ABC-type xylose transport system substrate-binding protein
MAKRQHGAGAGIPVLAYDQLITDCDLDLYMTFDNEKVGELQAPFLGHFQRIERKRSSAFMERKRITTRFSTSEDRTRSSLR